MKNKNHEALVKHGHMYYYWFKKEKSDLQFFVCPLLTSSLLADYRWSQNYVCVKVKTVLLL